MDTLRSGRAGRKAGLATVLMAICFGLVIGVQAPRAEADGPWGPDTCLSGYVWRDAGPNDHVCVTPARRNVAAEENALAASRRSPNGGPWGPDSCIAGFVWREAFAGDHVCTTPARRDQVRAENADGPRFRALDRFSSHVELPRVDRPTGFVDADVTVELSPNGAYSLHGWAQGTTLAQNDFKVACAVPLITGDALEIRASGKVGGAAGEQFRDIDVNGTSARVANHWTEIRPGQGAVCVLSATLNWGNLINRLRTIAQVAGTIISILA